MERPKRNYVLRKRFFNQSMAMLKDTIERLERSVGAKSDEITIQKMAESRAMEIEASCWDAKKRLKSDEYGRLVMAKTKQVCLALINKTLSAWPVFPELKAILAQLTRPQIIRPEPPQRVKPIPSFVQVEVKVDQEPEAKEDLAHIFPQLSSLNMENDLSEIPMFEEIRPMDSATATFDI